MEDGLLMFSLRTHSKGVNMQGNKGNKKSSGTTINNTNASSIPLKPSSTPKKNDETSEKLPTITDCLLSSTIFP